jgi:hypothetical protein
MLHYNQFSLASADTRLIWRGLVRLSFGRAFLTRHVG